MCIIMTENVTQPKCPRGRPKKYHNDEDKKLAYNRQIKERMLRNPFHCNICKSKSKHGNKHTKKLK